MILTLRENKKMIVFKFLTFSFLASMLILLNSCGGDEEVSTGQSDDDVSGAEAGDTETPAVNSDLDDTQEAEELLVSEEEEEKVVPNPNGVYLPTGE
jgi:hypothetical protein